MKLQKTPSLVLAIVLHIVPVCRVACLTPAAAPAGFAVLLRCLAGVGVLLGAVDAVSGASAIISGVVKYPFNPANPITTNAVGQVGAAFNYRIIVTGGLNDTNATYFNAAPLPPGLTINTNVGATGFISGVPTQAGVYFPVTVYAGNTIYDSLGGAPIHLDIMITINPGTGGSAPVFTTHPKSLTVTNGDGASFSAAATGSPTPTYQWRKDGTNIPGATTSNYSIAAVNTNHAARYTAVAANSSGSVTSQVATLTVVVRPSITTQPRDLTVTNGATGTFAVVAAGIPPPAYQWYFGVNPLPGQTTAALTLNDVTVAQAGTYSVVVSNSVGTITSQSATLNVVHVPEFTTYEQQGDQILLEFLREAGPAYEILHAEAVPNATWQTLTNLPPQATTGIMTILDSLNNGVTRFYRIRMMIP